VTDLVVPAKGLAISMPAALRLAWSGGRARTSLRLVGGVNVDLTVEPLNDVTFTLGGRRRTLLLHAAAAVPAVRGDDQRRLTRPSGTDGARCNRSGAAACWQRTSLFSWDVLIAVRIAVDVRLGRALQPAGYIYTDAVGTQYAMGGGRNAAIDYGP